MNPLQRTLIEKTGNDNGFEHVVASDVSGVTLASARHANRALVGLEGSSYRVRFKTGSPSLLPELQRSFPAMQVADTFRVGTEADLAALLRRAASLSRALPNQAVNDYQQEVAKELAELPAGIVGTEVERMVRQRVGQDIYRKSLLAFWDGRCAVTGIALPELLRASHAKPWKVASDTERLDVYNGLLLAVHLDALFDAGLLWFDVYGNGHLSNHIDSFTADQLHLVHPLKLRFVSAQHQPYLQYHRNEVAKFGSN